MFLILRRILIDRWGKEPPVMTNREELKKVKLENNGKSYLLRVGEEPRKIRQKKS